MMEWPTVVKQHVQGVAIKYSPKVFWQYFPTDWQFLIKFYTPRGL